jgi:release factor glutamine methyltransferase
MSFNIERRLYQICWIPIYRWLALRYIKKEREWRYHGLKLKIPPGVFHPGIYFSTPIFLDWLRQVDFQNKKTLDIGTGSGVIALLAAQQGAESWAVEINPLSAQAALDNAAYNGLEIHLAAGDLFAALPPNLFDYVLANPPYYPKKAEKMEDYAFLAGKNLEYYTRFFGELHPFITNKTKIWMILSEDCNWNEICCQAIGYTPKIVFFKKHWGERLFIAEFMLK